MKLRLGTRGSPLARWQASWVADTLDRLADVEVEVIEIRTQGDRQQVGPVGAIGSQGVFTKELQNALLANEIDLAVHSLKDLPTDPEPGLVLAAVPERGPVADVLVSRHHRPFAELPQAAWIGTGSLRRRSQLLAARPDLQMLECRGNVETRLRKLEEGQFDAIVLAEAGLVRLGWADRITQQLAPAPLVPAVGQGALGIETREDDSATRAAVASIHHADTFHAVLAERAMLNALRGGCLAPVGGYGRVERGQLRLVGVVASVDGRQTRRVEVQGPALEAEQLGRQAAEQLRQQGADALIAASRNRLD